MKNAHIIKLGGILALVSFLFLPVAGCGSMTISGIDLLKMNEISNAVKLFAVLAMLCALLIIFLKDKTSVLISAIGGFISLVIVYVIAKGKMNSGNDFGMSDAIDLKSGSYLSMLGFAIAAIISKIKNELFLDQHSDVTPPNQDSEKP